MLEIQLYNYTGHPDTVNKVLQNPVKLTGAFQNIANMVYPVFTVRTSTPITANYAYIPEFGRYYFIDDIRVITGDKTEIRLSVDVLKTYETEVLTAVGTLNESDTPNPFASNRNNVYNVKPKFQKIDFPNTGLFNADGVIIMVTIKGK